MTSTTTFTAGSSISFSTLRQLLLPGGDDDDNNNQENNINSNSNTEPSNKHGGTKCGSSTLCLRTECEKIQKVCDKFENLEILKYKLAIYESTLKKVKFQPQCASLISCSSRAPKWFDEHDLFLCPKHLAAVATSFDEGLPNIQRIMLERKGSPPGKETRQMEMIFKSLNRLVDSFRDGSINKPAVYPPFCWPLLVTKVLTSLRYVEKFPSECKDKDEAKMRIAVHENILKLLVLFRYTMNPIGEDWLRFITMLIQLLMGCGAALLAFLHAIGALVLHTLVPPLSCGFMAGMLAAAMVSPTKAIIGGGAAIAAGVATGISFGTATGCTIAGPLGAVVGSAVGVGAGALTGGVLALTRSLAAQQRLERETQVVDNVIGQGAQQVRTLLSIDDLDELKRALRALQ